jgi:head-tail adaptor
MRAGKMDRRIQLLRGALQDNGMNSALVWTDTETDALGPKLWAEKDEMSGTEGARAQSKSAELEVRFVVRFSALTRSVTPSDRLDCEGVIYGITRIKEIGYRDRLEFGALANADKLEP